MALGPVMLDIAGPQLSDADIRRLSHPLVGGVILFNRNYQSPQQLVELTRALRALRDPPLVIAVDHEGGRVQRFCAGFTSIPPMRKLGYLWDRDPEAACSAARDTGFVMGSELRACGIDVNLAPVLDVDYGQSHVIGDRAFHRNPQVIVELAGALIEGLKDTGIAPVGKHFPGHGFVAADSHAEVPVDERDYRAIEAADLVPFRQLIGRGLSGIMPAHVVFPKVDALAAGFSEVWLRQILRGTLGFEGVIFSDDLSMAGAAAAADDLVERARLALRAGCDVVLACNDSVAADVLLAGLRFDLTQDRAGPLERLCGGSNGSSMAQLHADARYLRALVSLARYATGDGMPPRSGST